MKPYEVDARVCAVRRRGRAKDICIVCRSPTFLEALCCGAAVCPACMRRWLGRHNTCPHCRAVQEQARPDLEELAQRMRRAEIAADLRVARDLERELLADLSPHAGGDNAIINGVVATVVDRIITIDLRDDDDNDTMDDDVVLFAGAPGEGHGSATEDYLVYPENGDNGTQEQAAIMILAEVALWNIPRELMRWAMGGADEHPTTID